MLTLAEVQNLSAEELRKIPREDRLRFIQERFEARARRTQENQIYFYEPASPEAKKIHLSTAKHVLATGGNRSSKTDSMLAEAVTAMTGIVPFSLEEEYPRQKLRCPMRVRLTVQSLTNTWEPVVKPKLQWNKWSGRGEPGGKFGHWGWIPKRLLIKGDWLYSWSEKNRTLTLTCGCTMQIMSYDQEVENFSGGSFHLILHDEGPPHAIYRENVTRTLDVGGRLITAMTPPDEESASWGAAWIYDELYEKGLPGPGKDPDIDAFTLFTVDNRILDLSEIQKIERGMSSKQKEVRLRGGFLHLGGRIYPTYTDRFQTWCFKCNETQIVDGGICQNCQGSDTVEFCHTTEPFDIGSWPVVLILDPHPRKPNCLQWVAVSPSDDFYVVAEDEIDAEPQIVKERVYLRETEGSLNIVKRVIDPNAGESPAGTGSPRGRTVRQDYDLAGLRCDLADDNLDTARHRIRDWLKPDSRTRKPRLQVFSTCVKTNFQMLRLSWDEWARYSSDMRDPKPKQRDKFTDFPACLQYFANLDATFNSLNYGGQVRSFFRRRRRS